jgi:3-oxoadipate enol-lactonase
MPVARIHGADLYYERHGEGPPLVFAHGIGGNHLSWWQQVPHFRDRYTCVVFDHPGFGRSALAPGEQSFVDSLGELLDELGLDRVHLMAQSMGGRTCLGYTLRHPERVRALVMASTMFPLDLPEFGDWRRESGRSFKALAAQGIHAAIGATMAREQPLLAFLYQEISALNPPWSPSNPPPGSVRVPDVGREALAGFATPTLFVIGEEDAAIPPRVLELAVAAVPGARAARFPRSGHSVYFERAAEFNRAVDGFLASAAAAPGG